MWKIAHRGASAHAPENTLLAVRKALELGADGIECDVHVCKSGEAVVIHDATLRRTTGGKGKVSAHTLAELKMLDAGQGEKIPTLEEFIREAKGRMVFIEIKDRNVVPETAKIVTRLAEKELGYEKLPVISFLLDTLLEIKKINPEILIGATPSDKRIPKGFNAKAEKARMWSVNPCIDILTKEFVDDAHARGLKIITWTCNTASDVARAKALGADGIVGDDPVILRDA